MYMHPFWGTVRVPAMFEWKVPYLGVDFGWFLLVCLLTSLVLLVENCGCELWASKSWGCWIHQLAASIWIYSAWKTRWQAFLENPDSSNCSFSSSISCFTTPPSWTELHVSLWPRNAWPWWLQLSPEGASIRHIVTPHRCCCDGNVGTAGFGSISSGVESYTKMGWFC